MAYVYSCKTCGLVTQGKGHLCNPIPSKKVVACDEHEEEIRYGVPSVTAPAEQAAICARYNIPRRVDYLWVYR